MQPHPKNDLLFLLRVLEGVEKIKIYSSGFTDPLTFFDANDGREFNACLMLLTHIGEPSLKISDELKERHREVNRNEIKGFRNHAVHDYTGLDRFITFDIIKQHTPQLKDLVSTLVHFEIHQGSFDKEEHAIAQTSHYLKHVDFAWVDGN